METEELYKSGMATWRVERDPGLEDNSMGSTGKRKGRRKGERES